MKLESGVIVTIEGVYRRRTFLEWLFRKPRELQKHTVQLTAPDGREHRVDFTVVDI